MSAAEIDQYLQGLPEPKRGTLEEVRRRILEVLPESEQCISYNMPAFRVGGKVVAGFAAFTNHLAYLPHSGSVFSAMTDDLAGFTYTTGSLHFPVDEPLSSRLVEKLIATRLSQLA
jgi:uncharacterized protein YdhG (YjbR/CyaY superfamily)